MKVILLKDVKGLGRRYEEKNVADGFALNMLIPKKMAVQSSGPAAALLKSMKEGESKHKEVEHTKLEAEVAKLAGTTVSIIEKANDKGHLFAAITTEKISEILKGKGINIPEARIVLVSPIKEVGVHSIPISIDGKESRFNLEIQKA